MRSDPQAAFVDLGAFCGLKILESCSEARSVRPPNSRYVSPPWSRLVVAMDSGKA